MRKGILSTYTAWIIIANIVAFFLFSIFISIYGGDAGVSYFALQPASILAGQKLWTFLTSMFLHANLTHLLVNMLSLFFIGTFVEKLIGKKRYIALYFGGGLVAGVFFVALAGFFGNSDWGIRIFGSPMTYAVGASGAIFCLGGLLAILTPRMPVLVFFVIPMPMWAAMIGMLGVLWILSATAGLPIGNLAHLGGLLTGVFYGFYLKQKYPKKTQMIARYFSK